MIQIQNEVQSEDIQSCLQVDFKATRMHELTKQVYMDRKKDGGQNLGSTPKFRELEDEQKQSKGNKQNDTKEVAGEPREHRSWNRDSKG